MQANVVNTLIVPAASKVAPYYDDFDETKNFHRIMFRPGYAVQARELTQLQTILQNQVERFGRHIFVNGSSVIGGKLDISDIVTLNVETQYQNTDITVSDFKDKTIIHSSGNNTVIARVIETSEADANNGPSLQIRYLTGQEFGDGATIVTTDVNGVYANLTLSGSRANGTVGFIYDSIYFMQGYFIKVPKQTVVVTKYDRQANTRVGLEYQDDIITEYNDATLLDPAQETSNYQAPGAGRYKLDLVLSTRPLDSADDEKFINVAEIQNGIIRRQFTTPLYSELEEVFARRTYDTNGNYIVRPFRLKVEDSQVDPANNFSIAIGPGKAYVYGYECENQATTKIEIPRARQTKTRLNYNINVNYGNYVIVENLKGTFNTNRQGLVDLHCVKWDDVNLANTSTYGSTKIGTVRVKDLQYYGAADASNTTSRQYELYFYDNKFNTITGNASAFNSNTYQITINSANSSNANDAYTGAYVKILSGNSSGDLRYITEYDGLTKVASVSVPFSANTGPSSYYELRFDITDVDSFYQYSPFTGGATTNAAATISLVNKDNGTYNGNTYISEPTFSDSFYPYPTPYIAPGIENISYVYRRVYNSVTFNNGLATITSATNEQFDGATSTSNTSLSVMDNFLVVVTDNTGSDRNVGDQVKITTTISTSTPETAQLNTANSLESFTATVYSRMQITGPSARVKTLVTANTTTLSTAAASATFQNSTGSTTKVYLPKGQVVIQNPSTKLAESLFISDVVDVVKVYYSSSEPTLGTDLTLLTDVTKNYIVDRGQKTQYYDHASIKLKPGIPSKPGYIIACCRYYSHTNDTGFFSVDSYPSLNTTITEEGRDLTTGYALIPVVGGVRMSDQVDFRPARPNAANTNSWTFNTARTPIAVTDFTSDYSFYVERKDIVVLTVNDELQLIQGNINNKQSYPDAPSRSLLLHRLSVLPYTINKSDIIVNTLDHRRYTMADIARIDKRLKYIEYTTSLNTLEKSAADLTIKDVNGLDRMKYGILAEDFTSHLLADSTNPDYSCAVDVTGTFSPTGGILMPRTVSNYIKLQANTASSSGISVFDDKVMLSFRTAPAITQSSATKSSALSEYLFADFRGQIITVPDADQWKDVTYLPEEVVSLPQPVIKFDITATDITNITNNQNTTTITNIDQKFDIEETTQVDRLLLATQGGYLGLLQPLTWNGSRTDCYGANGIYTYQGFSSCFPLYPADVDETGACNTVGMRKNQFYQVIGKMCDDTGWPGGAGQAQIWWQVMDEVYGCYNVICNRPPDPGGEVFWCFMYGIHKLDFQGLREWMTRAAIEDGELSSTGWDRGGVNNGINLTPKYIINADMTASLATNLKVDTSQAGNYATTTTPDGRIQALAPTDESAIEEMYQTYLGRHSDPEGLQFWLAAFRQWKEQYGLSEAVVKLDEAFRTAAPQERQQLDAQFGRFTSTYVNP